MPRIVNRIAYIVEACVGKSVLHIGCADWPHTERQLKQEAGERFLHAHIEKVSSRCVGVDIAEHGIALCHEFGYKNVVYGDVEHLAQYLPPDTFDVVVAGEIIEHLSNPGLALASINGYMSHVGRLIMTVPNSFSMRHTMRTLFVQQERVHPDHVARYSEKTIQQLLRRHGFKVNGMAYCNYQHATMFKSILVGMAWPVMRINPRLCDTVLADASKLPPAA